MNLIQLSELFHITIDYLVKNNECSPQVNATADLQIQELTAFRMEAIKNTYAGYADCCTSSRPGSFDYQYEKDDYLYYDSWLGGAKFSGEEAVWKAGTAIYSMNYFGRLLKELGNTNFLKEALCHATPEYPCRGPEFYQSGEYTYKTKMIGDIQWFQGYEEIFCQNTKVYECYYHGGVLI